MWSITLQEKNSSIEPSHLVVIHHIFLLNPQVKIHKWEKNQPCSKTGLQMYSHPKTTSGPPGVPVHQHSPYIGFISSPKRNGCSISAVYNLAMWGATLQLDGNKVSRTQWFHFTRRCIWLLLQKASLGGCYCKRLAVVVACAGHTCINRTSFRLPNMPDITIAVAQRWGKALAREAKNPNRLSGSVSACRSLNDSPFRGNRTPLPVFVYV